MINENNVKQLDSSEDEKYARYITMAENMHDIDQYMMEYNNNHSLWDMWKKHATESEYETLQIFYLKLCKSNFNKIKKFLDYAMTTCTTTNMQVNIERICTFYKVENIEDINENVLYVI